MLSLAISLLLVAAPPAAHLAEPSPTITVRSELHEATEDLLHAEGNVVFESGGLVLRADLLDYDRRQRAGSAQGNLILVDGDLVLLADEGSFSLEGEGRLLLRRGTLLLKKRAPKPGSVISMSASDARKAGRNALILKAEQMDRVARGRFLAKQFQITSCDCGEDAPDWAMRASSADIEIGERAILYWPAFRIKDVPVLLLPALYVPLSARRTGLLLPRVSRANGFAIDQPLFITLGESYDLTVALGVRLGRSTKDALKSRDEMLGPSASAEFRYAPAEGTGGRLFLSSMNDSNSEYGKACMGFGDHNAPVGLPRGPRGWRGGLEWKHSTETRGGWGLIADARLASDAYYVADSSTDALEASAVPYRRSQAQVFWRGESALLSMSTGWYQDQSAPADNFALFGSGARISYQRPLSFRFEVPKTRLVGPVRGGLEIAAAHYRPIPPGGESTRARLLRSMSGKTPLTLSRFDFRPSLAMTLLGRGPVAVEAYAAARGDVSAYAPAIGTGPRRTDWWGRAIAGLWAGTEVSRVFGQGDGAMRHSVTPRLELRASTLEWDERGEYSRFVVPVDEYDFYQRAADPSLLQGLASLTTRLSRKKGFDLLRLELGQGVDFNAGKPGDAFGRLDLQFRHATLTAGARYDVERSETAAAAASLALRDGRGDSVRLGFERLGARGTDRMRAGLDDLIKVGAADRGEVGNKVSADVVVSPTKSMVLRYGVVLSPGAPEKVLEHRGAVSLRGRQDCWKLDLELRYSPLVDKLPRATFVLELENLGSFGN